MKYTFRIFAFSLVVFGVVGWSLIDPIIFGINIEGWKRFLLFLVASFLYGILGWRVGKAFDEAKFYAEKDSLTGLYNRRMISRLFPKYANRARRLGKKMFVCVIDMDDFKQINDECGHEFGDFTIQALGHIIQMRLKPEDLVARWGNNEFLVLSTCIAEQELFLFLEQLEKDLEMLSNDLKRSISVSAGYSFYPEEAASLEGLLQLSNYHMNDQKAIKKYKKNKKML